MNTSVQFEGMDELIKKYMDYIKDLVSKGVPRNKAAKMAHQKYPIMDEMREQVTPQIVVAMENGYGGHLGERAVQEAMKLSWSPDNLTLSQRTTRGDKRVARAVSNVIQEQIRQNRTYKETALKIYDGYNNGGVIPKQELPNFIQDLIKASKADRKTNESLKRAVNKAMQQAERLRNPSLKIGYKNLIKAIDKRNDEMLEKALKGAAYEKTRHAAHRIAKTELVRAYHDGFLARYQDDEEVIAYKWCLSGRHKLHDICDVHANANLYGLGKGIYPKDKLPMLPAHPYCMCHLKPVYKGTVDESQYKENIDKGGREYIDKLSSRELKSLFNKEDLEKYRQGKTPWTELARGYTGKHTSSRVEAPPKPTSNKPKVGRVVNRDEFTKNNKKAVELKIADLLVKKFGGDLYILDEKAFKGKSADFRWNKKSWELKTLAVSNPKSVGDRLRKALHQLNTFNMTPGGVILDITKCEFSIEDCLDEVIYRLERSAKSDLEVILIKGDDIRKIKFKFKKEK